MIKKLTLTKIYRSTTNKDGQELRTKDGRPYEKLGIKTEEYGDKWLSGFGNRFNENWREGNVVEVEVEQKGEYLNFKGLTPIDLLAARVAKLENDFTAFKIPQIQNQEIKEEYGHAERMPSEDGSGTEMDIPF
ncbi:MAG: hypothetical protein AAB706_02320 [Patescibacteria group bacterium]|mgnify:CR=1 FL=1